MLAGVCSGIGERLSVDPTLVRLAFAFLAFAAGAGIIAYLGAWALLPAPGESSVSRRRRIGGTVLLIWAAILALHGVGLAGSLVWPLALVAAGLVVAAGSVSLGLSHGAARAVAAVLVFCGVLVFIGENTRGTATTLLAPGAVAVALILVLGPWAFRLARERDAERAERIRTQEREELAARVHDSVLQTLALIQREPNDPRRVATLARRQERELRAWLYPSTETAQDGTLAGAVDAAAAEIEEMHGVRVEVVRTGDAPLDDRTRALVLAAREAMANAVEALRRRRGLRVPRRGHEARRPVRARPRLRVRPGLGRRRPPRHRRVDPGEDGARGRNRTHRLVAGRGHRGGARAAAGGRAMSRPLRRVVLVDDHDLFRAGVRSELGSTVEIVGEAASVLEAVPLIKELDPDVVLLDVHLPDGGGQSVIVQVAPERPGVKFLALSVSDAAEDVIGVIRAGARGYVTKTISAEELTEAVHRTADGDAVFSPRLAGFVLDAFRSGEATADPELDQLTAREREVLQLIARGYRYKEIAARLHLSARTVESHVSAVLRKLQLSNRNELTRWAAQRRLI